MNFARSEDPMATLIDYNTVKAQAEGWIEAESGFDTIIRAFQSLSVSVILGVDEEDARDSVVDGGFDRGIDAIYIDERGGSNVIHLFQFKYAQTFEKSKTNFPSSEIDKILSFISDLLDKDPGMQATCNPLLWEKVEQAWEAMDRPNPTIEVHFCSNTLPLVASEQSRIDKALEKYRWVKSNSHDLDRLVAYFVKKNKPVIDRSIKIVDKDYFERTDGNVRALICTVEASEIVAMISDPDGGGGVYEPIFDDNVRVYLSRNNAINKEIIATALSEDRHLFWYLNNGLTITCESFSYPKGARAPTVDLKNLQIVNGGQTSHALFEAFSKDRDAASDVLVVARIIEAKTEDVGSRVSETTNSQTPINSRDLKANTLVQKKIEQALEGLGLFYERKSNQYAEKPKDKRIDAYAAGQSFLAYEVQLPEVAKKDRGRIFGDLFETVFSDAIDPAHLVTSLRLYEKINLRKKAIQKLVRAKEAFDQDHLYLIDGAHHVLFAIRHLCLRDGVDAFNLSEAEKYVDEAIEVVKVCVLESKAKDKGFSYNRYFKDSMTRTHIAAKINP